MRLPKAVSVSKVENAENMFCSKRARRLSLMSKTINWLSPATMLPSRVVSMFRGSLKVVRLGDPAKAPAVMAVMELDLMTLRTAEEEEGEEEEKGKESS